MIVLFPFGQCCIRTVIDIRPSLIGLDNRVIDNDPKRNFIQINSIETAINDVADDCDVISPTICNPVKTDTRIIIEKIVILYIDIRGIVNNPDSIRINKVLDDIAHDINL